MPADAATFDRQRAHRILSRLLDRPGERRAALLDRFCARDPALKAAVVRLLRAAEAPGWFEPGAVWTDSLWSGWSEHMERQPAAMTAGTMVGPYRIVEEIGRGGMAVVYRAERADGELVREVAFKILKPGFDVEEAVSRFEQERQILADLNHPNIARLFDAGRTPDGRPFFVMELIRGEPIDRYCDEHRLSIEQRLDLFCVVARAVGYAHQKLVVHRDLKPSNILVAGNGEVKLLDFGIARMLDVDAGGVAMAPPTQAPAHLMTPEYASPEQIRGERMTTASDIYQLGLLLYELLSGHRPYVLPRHRFGELERIICEQPPARLSTAPFRTETLKPSGPAAVSLEAACNARRLSPLRLQRRLRGDLENITLKALSKEPELRYGSADRLAQDIRRHRNGLPVSARAYSWRHRAWKFLRRNAIATGSAAAMVVLIAALTTYYLLRIQGERDRAHVEAVKARQVSQFITGLFRGADPRQARGRELTARQLLDRGARELDQLTGQPEIAAQMQQTLGRIYLELGLYASAEPLLLRALELRRQALPMSHPDIARSLSDLGELRHAQGDYETARALLEDAAAMFERRPDADPTQRVATLRALGYLLYREFGEHDRGRAILEQALALYEQSPGADFDGGAHVLQSLGTQLFELGALTQAEHAYEHVLAIQQKALGEGHPSTGTALNSLAFVRLELGKLDGLEDLYRRGLTILENVYGPDHPRVATALNNLAHMLVQTGRPAEAVDLLQRSLRIRVAAVGDDHPDIAYPLVTLGDAYFSMGRFDAAREQFHRSARLRQPGLEARRFDGLLIHIHVRLGTIESQLGNAASAKAHYEIALDIWRAAPESTDPRLVPSLLPLGEWLVREGRCEVASTLLIRARRLLAMRQPPAKTEIDALDALLNRCPENG